LTSWTFSENDAQPPDQHWSGGGCRRRGPAVAIPKGGFLMYIGVGTVVFILVIVLIIYFVRRA